MDAAVGVVASGIAADVVIVAAGVATRHSPDWLTKEAEEQCVFWVLQRMLQFHAAEAECCPGRSEISIFNKSTGRVHLCGLGTSLDSLAS